MKKYMILTLTTLIFLTRCKLKSAGDYIHEGNLLSEQYHYKQAIDLYNKAIKKDPQNISAYINRAEDHSSLGHFQEAITDYAKVLHIDPQNILALVNTGNDYQNLGEYPKAIACYNRALLVKNSTASPIADAEQTLSEAALHTSEILYKRAIAYYNIDSMQQAYQDFYLASQDRLLKPECYYWIASIYFARGNASLGCETLQKSKTLGYPYAAAELKKHCPL